MKKQTAQIMLVVLMSMITTLTFIFFIWQNHQTNRYNEYQNIILDDTKLYAVDNIIIENDGYSIKLTGINQDITLLVDRIAPFNLYLNNDLIYQYSGQTFNRVLIIELPHSIDYDLKFQMQQNKTIDALGRWRPVILFGNQAAINRAALNSFGITVFYCGLLLFIAINSIILFFYKVSEKYLALLSFVAFVEFMKTIASSIYPLLLFSDRFILWFLPTIYLTSSIFILIISVFLLKQYLPSNINKYITVKNSLLFGFIYIIIQSFLPYNITSIISIIIRILFIGFLIKIYEKDRFDVLIISIGYAFLQATQLFNSLIFDYNFFTIGSPIVLYMIIQIGFIFYIFCCSVVVNYKFALHFKNSEFLNLELDNQVKLRTLQLEIESKQRRNIMSNLFHDLRNPIFVLNGYLQQLNINDNEQQHLVKVMKTRLSFLHKLVEDLFLTVKLEENALTFEFDEYLVNDIINDVITANQLLANDKNIIIEYLAFHEANIWADNIRLQQALNNIVYNAINYSPNNSKVIITTAMNRDRIEISIQDFGKGIPQSDLPFLFQRYYQSNFSKNKASSGLGLAIANDIIKHHQGDIIVNSVINEFSTFIIRLPIL